MPHGPWSGRSSRSWSAAAADGRVAYLTLWERKAAGWSQIRHGSQPHRPWGLLQPIADASRKLIFKEIIGSDSGQQGPVLPGARSATIMPAMAAWAVIPFGPEVALANVNAGLLFDGHHLDGSLWRDHRRLGFQNSKYAFSARCAPGQMVSYEIAMGFARGRADDGRRLAQHDRHRDEPEQGAVSPTWGLSFLSWNWLPLLPITVVYFISGLAETNRHPFDVVEGESEIVAGHMIEYSGMSFAMFFLAEYANMILVSTLAAIMFFGRLAAPIEAPGASSPAGSGWDQGSRSSPVPLGARHVPAVPLRPDHASGLEDLHPRHPGLAGRRGRLDPCRSLEHLAETTGHPTMNRPIKDFFVSSFC